MNTQHERPSVVVGVDGTDDNRGALRFGLEEARARGARLHLVHVVPDYVPVSPMMPLTPADLVETGRAVLEEAMREAGALGPDVLLHGTLRHGTRTTQLVQAAEDAELLVIGRDSRPLVERLWRGNTATGVAARADTPVVQVPADWAPERRGVVVVGVRSPHHAGGMLAAAFAAARRQGATLVVLHTWRLPTVYDDIIEVRVDLDRWQQEAEVEIEALLRDWRAAYPDVRVEIRVVHDYAAHALVECSGTADLLVLTRRAHGVPAGAHLGSTARGVLRGAHCPVEVVAPVDVTPMPSLVLEESGSFTP